MAYLKILWLAQFLDTLKIPVVTAISDLTPAGRRGVTILQREGIIEVIPGFKNDKPEFLIWVRPDGH